MQNYYYLYQPFNTSRKQGEKIVAMQLIGPLHNLKKSDCVELVLLSRLTMSHMNATELCMPLQHKVVSHQAQTF